MDASEFISPPGMGFSKYPDLPKELRLQIIEHAAIEARNPHGIRKPLTQLSYINSEWNHIIERILFKAIHIDNEDLVEFGTICGKRHGLLRKVWFTIYLSDLTGLASSSPEEFFVDCLSQLFHSMKGWSCEEKRPHRLIELCISMDADGEDLSNLSCDFRNLPDVQVIGSIKPNEPWYDEFVLDSSSMQTLYGKLPNLYHGKLDFTHGGSLQEMVHDISSRIVATHTLKPSLSKLSVFHLNESLRHFQDLDHGDQVKFTKALTPLLSLWSNSLVHLKLSGGMDMAQFLLTASNSVWPRLRRLDLEEYQLNRSDHANDGAGDSNKQDFSDVLEGLVAALPSMQDLARVDISSPDGPIPYYLFRMDLTPRRDTEFHVHGPMTSFPWPNKDAIIPCGSLPTPAGATAQANFMILPGHLVTELQYAVWKHRRLELAVFCCGKGSEWIESPEEPACWGFICKIWNRKTETWDPALMNDMDIFIYEMGIYWWQVNHEQER